MSRQLPADCLNEIFEYLEKDKATLHSCLLVNRLWCEVSVRILWRNVWNCKTLISCFPNESKEILYKNKIIIPTPTSKPPLFNYMEFIKSLTIYQIDDIIKNILKNYQSITPQNLSYKKFIIAQETYKLLMNQIYSLRELNFESHTILNIPKIIFATYPGAKECLKDLRELSCRSDIYPEFFYQLSQLCHNIHYLSITFEEIISNGLTDLISVQQNLKYLDIMQSFNCNDLTNIIPSLTELPNTLTELDIYGYYIPLSFISRFTNLQKIVLTFDYYDSFDEDFIDPFKDFDELQYVSFPQLQCLRFEKACPNTDSLTKFLEYNGKSLKEFYVDINDNLLNLSISKFCPNLEILSTIILDHELGTLKEIFNNCKYLESFRFWCGGEYLKENELLKVVAKHSPKNFYELKLYYIDGAKSELFPEELESFFISWMNRIPQKSLFLIIVSYSDINSLDKNEESMKIIEKYIKLGVIKKFTKL